jgi:signal transduction histidine kinase/ActR/RegA family two-component response regulator
MIRERFGRLPIRLKLVTMIMATSCTVLTLSSLGYLVLDYHRAKNEMVRELEAQAQVIMENSDTALLYNDRTVAEATLATLKYNTHVRAACLYRADGRLFASFVSGALTPCPSSPLEDRAEFSDNRLHLWAGPLVKGERIGTLYVRSDLQVLQSRVREQLLIVGLMLVVALGVALLLSSLLQALVSEPVTALARTAAEVSRAGDYSLRATRSGDDELGELVEAMNRMLERIQLREGELSNANEDLRREIAERRRAEQERAELLVREREANRLKDEFLATLSHELRTPLNAILGWTRLMRSSAVPPGGLDRALEKVERNAQAQTRLVEDLLEVSRIASGKLRLDVKSFDLVTVTNTAIDSIRPAAEARGVSVIRAFQAATLPTAGDPDRLQQVIWNLLSNAVKFTPAGGSVTIALRRDHADDELVVTDTGAGIDPAFLPNVFETFRQADSSSTRTYGGLGLGLSIVRNLVEMHGGTVQARSAGLGQGASFTVRLPVRLSEPARQAPPTQSELAAVESRLAGVSIVVVDDDQDTRELLTSILETAGASVRPAASADEGFAACLEDQPDALVSDIGMPGQDGYELMRHLQAALGSRTPRVTIALTAFATDRDRQRSAEAGFQRHIAKPFDPAALIATIAELLSEGAEARS